MSTASNSPENSPAPETNSPAAPAADNNAANAAGEQAKRGPIKVGRSSGPVPGSQGGGQGGGGQRRDRGPRPPKPQRPRRENAEGGEGQTASQREDQEEAALEAAAEQQRAGSVRGRVEVPNRRAPLSADLEAELQEALGGLSLDDVVSGKVAPAGRIENETRVRAQVIEVHGDNVFVSLGGKNQGVVSVRNFETPPAIGDMLEVIVTGFNAEDELHEVNVPGGKVVGGGDWNNLVEGSLVDAKVTAANSGGLECTVGGTRGFIPASQVSIFRSENLADYVDQKLLCVVTEANQQRGNLVLSRRAVLEREKEESKKKILAELEPGQVREGIVRKIQDFGAFVDLGGVDGLIHISQLSWERVKHPSEILKEGQKIRVRVERIDPDTGKIGLSLKNPEEHPWAGIEQRFPVGTVIHGPVTRLASFGCFVKIAPGVEGMVHISELAHHRVFAVQNVVKEGQEVEAKILSIDPEAQRIALSMKACIQPPQKEASAKKEEAAPVDEPPRAPIVPKRTGELKGGTKRKGGGEKFGLNW